MTDSADELQRLVKPWSPRQPARRKRGFPVVKSGEWVQPVIRGYLMKCCSCGLVHSLHFRVHKGRIQFKAYRK